MEDDGEASLVERWTRKLQNRPLVAAIVIFATVVAGIGSFSNSLNDLLGLFRESSKPSPIVVTLPSPSPQPPAKRVSFSEDFELGEIGTYSSSHGVSVRTQFIRPNEAQIGASADGPVNSLEEHTSGDQIPLYRQDCDRLIVTIKDTSFEIKGGLTLEQVQKLGPAGGMLVDRKVVGSISGKCEE